MQGGVSLDGIRRPNDGLFPAYVGGGLGMDRELPGPSRGAAVPGWSSSRDGRGMETALSTDLQDLALYGGGSSRVSAAPQEARGSIYEQFEEDSGGRYSRVAPARGASAMPPPPVGKFDVYPDRRVFEEQDVRERIGGGGTPQRPAPPEEEAGHRPLDPGLEGRLLLP